MNTLSRIIMNSSVMRPFLVKQRFSGRSGWERFIQCESGYSSQELVFLRKFVDAVEKDGESAAILVAYEFIVQSEDFVLASFFKEVFIESGYLECFDDNRKRAIDGIVKRRSYMAYRYSEMRRSTGKNMAQLIWGYMILSMMGHYASIISLVSLCALLVKHKPVLMVFFPIIVLCLLVGMLCLFCHPQWATYWRYYDVVSMAPNSVDKIERKVINGGIEFTVF